MILERRSSLAGAAAELLLDAHRAAATPFPHPVADGLVSWEGETETVNSPVRTPDVRTAVLPLDRTLARLGLSS